jgi:hypothetical protein
MLAFPLAFRDESKEELSFSLGFLEKSKEELSFPVFSFPIDSLLYKQFRIF